MRQKLLAALIAALTLLPVVSATAQDDEWEDVTSLLKDPSFETDGTIYWTGWSFTRDAKDETYKQQISTENKWTWGRTNQVTPSDGTKLFWIYSNYAKEEEVSHTISQTITNLSPGTYRVSADMYTRSYSSNCYALLSASPTTETTRVEHVRTGEKFNNYTLTFTVPTTQGVTISIRFTLTGHPNADHHSFFGIDNVRLEKQTKTKTLEELQAENAKLSTDVFGANYTSTTPYNVIMHATNDNHNVDGKAVSCQPGNPTEGTYEHKFTNVAGQTHRGQAFFFEPVETDLSIGCFIMSYTNHEGGTNYICTAKTGYGSSQPAENLRATTDRTKALKIHIEQYGNYVIFHNTEANGKIIGGRDQGFYTADTYRNLTIEPAATVSVPVEIAAGGYATRIFPFAPAAIEGVEYYSCTGVNEDNELTLALVATPRANKPYILHATGAAVSETLTGYATARDDAYAEEQLTGVYTSTTAPTGSYVLQTIDGKQAFYLVTAADPISMPANRCYLTVPATGVKAFKFPTATGLTTTRAPRATKVIYDLSGRRLTRLTKGVNIVNGKKIVK